MKTLERQDLYDILLGCTILGTGGGGSLEEGLELVFSAFDRGKRFRLADFSEVPDEAWIATPYMCGSISPTTPELEARYARLPVLEGPEAFHAYRALEEYFGQAFYGVISTELGGGNTAQAFYVAALLDRVIIDADPAGRSVPELQHSTYYLYDLPIHPLACASQFGDVAILTRVVNDLRAEALVRAMAVASKNRIGVADHPAQARVLRNAVIRGAISRAWEIGRAFRQAREQGKPGAPAAARAGDGVILFQGRVQQHGYETVDGFTIGDVYIHGEGDYDGSDYHVWFKNEHIVAWRDDRWDVSVPDLICIFDDETNMPNLNPHFREGQQVTVIGLPSPAEWRTPRGLGILGPAHFGFDHPYVPLEMGGGKKE